MDENKPMNSNPETGERTFTQEEVNRIVGERLAKEKAKGETALAERERQLAMRELRMTAKEKLTEMGLPMGLLDALNLSSPEALDKALETVQKAFDTGNPAKRIYEVHRLPESTEHPGESLDRQLRKAMRLPD